MCIRDRLLGVPTFAVIYYIVKRVVNYALRKKKLPEDTRDYTKTTGVDTKNTVSYTHLDVYKRQA